MRRVPVRMDGSKIGLTPRNASWNASWSALRRIWPPDSSICRRGRAFVTLAAVLAAVAAPGWPAPAAGAKAAAPITLVALGDSLTAGFGLPPDAAFPVQLETTLRARGHNVRVVNAGVSGDTAADGLARLDWATPEDADGVIVELGANDALRGLAPPQTARTLAALLTSLKERRLPVLLAGMRAPRNWGPEYAESFEALYPELARTHGVLLYPFFLEGVALRPDLNQPDGLHPTRAGVAVIVERITPSVETLLNQIMASRAGAPR